MAEVKWFSGGQERKKVALQLINDLIIMLEEDNVNESLIKVLNSYKKELETENGMVPLILSRMNMEISNILTKNEITLTEVQSDKLKKLSELSYIRYGY